MWCWKCHYGCDEYMPFGEKCPQCGVDTKDSLEKNPFPERPLGMGSGKPRNRTPVKKPEETPAVETADVTA